MRRVGTSLLVFALLAALLAQCTAATPSPTPTPQPTATPTSTPTPTPTATPTPTPTPEPLISYQGVSLYEGPGNRTRLVDETYSYEITFPPAWLVILPEKAFVQSLMEELDANFPNLSQQLESQIQLLLQTQGLRAFGFYTAQSTSGFYPNVNITVDPVVRLASEKQLEAYLAQVEVALQQLFPQASIQNLGTDVTVQNIPLGALIIVQTIQGPQGPVEIAQLQVVLLGPKGVPVILTFSMPREQAPTLLETNDFAPSIVDSFRYLEREE